MHLRIAGLRREREGRGQRAEEGRGDAPSLKQIPGSALANQLG